MTTTDQPAGLPGQPSEVRATDITPSQKLAMAALGALLGRNAEPATSLLLQLVTQYGQRGVHEALVLLCSLPITPLRHRCVSGGTVTLPVPGDLPDDKHELWDQAATTAGELLAGTLGENAIRLRTALNALNDDNVLPVLTLVSQYVTSVLDAANKAAGAALGEYRTLVEERATEGGSS